MAEPKATFAPDGYERKQWTGKVEDQNGLEFETDPGKKKEIASQKTRVADRNVESGVQRG